MKYQFHVSDKTNKNLAMELPSFVKKIALVVFYGLSLSLLGMYLFFPGIFSAVRGLTSGLVSGSFVATSGVGEVVSGAKDTLKIALTQAPEGVEPTSLDPTTRTLALQVYEPLVRTDELFHLQPAVASSWGRVTPTQWQFTLRPDVIFQNNRPVTVDDVIASFHRAAQLDGSDLKALVRGMQVVAKDEHTFEIDTDSPDALLLQKISEVMIIPQENELKMVFAPLGTGPYVFSGMKRGESFSFERFAGYWGQPPTYRHVDFVFYPKSDDRVHAISSGDADIAVDIPPDSIKALQRTDVTIHTLPSLEVNFLVFNRSGIFKEPVLRQAVSLALDSAEFERFAGGYATSVNQYVSSGVFGYSPKIAPRAFDVAKAKGMIQKLSGFDLIPVNLTFVEGLETAGEYVKKQLTAIGFTPTVTYIPWTEFRANLLENQSDIFFYGWKSDLGSSADFFANAVHTRDSAGDYGQFNAANYSNDAVDSLIEKSASEFAESKRLDMYQRIMQHIVERDYYGVPLFESQRISASRSNAIFLPRIDGYVLAQEIH